MPRLLAFLLAAGLSACGMKGSLTLPPGPQPEPLFGNAKPQSAPAGSIKDVSTDPAAPRPQ